MSERAEDVYHYLHKEKEKPKRRTPWGASANGAGEPPTEIEVLLGLRRRATGILVLHIIFVSVVVAAFGLGWNEVRKYELLKPDNINTINENVVAILSNANAASASAVPLVANFEFMSGGLAGLVVAVINGTGLNVTQAPAGRHLLEDPPAPSDAKMRKMVYNQVHRLLAAANERVEGFNVTAFNELLSACAVQLRHVNFTGFAERYDRTIGDIEATAHYGLLSSSLFGLASYLTNTSIPVPAKVVADVMSGMHAPKLAAA